jgi:hypothetical protein
LIRKTTLAIATIAALATTALAPTAASAHFGGGHFGGHFGGHGFGRGWGRIGGAIAVDSCLRQVVVYTAYGPVYRTVDVCY